MAADCESLAGAGSWDAVVIGAGPAGAISARELARRGARVLLVEKKPFPRAKVCGGCLNGRAIAVLESIGLAEDAHALGVPLEGLTLGLAGRLARLPLPAGLALSRSTLDAALVRSAVAEGVSFVAETSGHVGPVRGDARTAVLTGAGGSEPVEVRAKVVIAAAGLGSRCLEEEGSFATRVARRSRLGAGCLVAEYPPEYRPGAIFMAVGREGYVGLVRVDAGLLNVAAAFAPGFLKRFGTPAAAAAAVLAEAGFAAIPALPEADWLGTLPLTRQVRPVAAERLFLVGDATGYTEPFTGEGMAWAMAGAVGLAPFAHRAIDRWDESLARAWIAWHRRAVRPSQRVCLAIASLLHHPLLARAAFALTARAPRAANHLIVHINRPRPHPAPSSVR